jgi:hypothetical protein
MSTQTELPFASLDFPGRTILIAAEIAQRLGLTARHICNLVDSGELVAVDASSAGSSRRTIRIVAESYRQWLCKKLTGPAHVRAQFLAHLPPDVMRQLASELISHLPPSERATLRAQFPG